MNLANEFADLLSVLRVSLAVAELGLHKVFQHCDLLGRALIDVGLGGGGGGLNETVRFGGPEPAKRRAAGTYLRPESQHIAHSKLNGKLLRSKVGRHVEPLEELGDDLLWRADGAVGCDECFDHAHICRMIRRESRAHEQEDK
jgi:hypothetical protein